MDKTSRYRPLPSSPSSQRKGCATHTWRKIAIPLTFYAIFVGGITLGGCASRLLLFPSVDPRDAHGLSRRTIPSPGGQVELWSYRGPAAGPGAVRVLEFTGNAERAEGGGMFAPGDWRELPAEVWVANYPGFGGSSGPGELGAIPPMALAAYDRLAAEAGGAPIVVMGSSMGTTAALHVAAHRRVAAVILNNPPPLQNLILCRHGWWNLWLLALPISWQVPGELNSLTSAGRVKAPALFIHSEEDEVVPLPYQQKVYRAYAGPKRALRRPGASHNTPLSARDRQRIMDQLKGLLGITSS